MVQRGRDQLMDILLNGEVSRSQRHQLSGSNWSGVYVLVGSIPPLIANFSHLEGASVFAKQLKDIVVCIDGEPGPCPKAALLFLLTVCFSLVWHPLPSLINKCLNLLIGTQGRSWRQNKGYFL